MKMKPIEELTFTDDYMFGEVMRNEEICKGLLERLLDIKIDRVEYPELQKVISHFYDSKGVRLDVYVDGGDKVFDIEIQNRLPRNLPKRARYYHSLMDLDLLAKGDDYILGERQPLYSEAGVSLPQTPTFPQHRLGLRPKNPSGIQRLLHSKTR